MPISGKYDFKGIKKMGRLGLKSALSSNPSTAWILKGGAFTDAVLDFVSNWLANNGLILLNGAAYYVGGKLDQAALDKAIDNGLAAIEIKGRTLTPQEIKDIDDAVIKAADNALPYGRKPTPASNDYS